MTREQFAATLKEFRRSRGLTQETAAAELGISVRTLQNWEIARNMPSGFGLKALLAVLGTDAPATGEAAARPVSTDADSTSADALATHLL